MEQSTVDRKATAEERTENERALQAVLTRHGYASVDEWQQETREQLPMLNVLPNVQSLGTLPLFVACQGELQNAWTNPAKRRAMRAGFDIMMLIGGTVLEPGDLDAYERRACGAAPLTHDTDACVRVFVGMTLAVSRIRKLDATSEDA